jgi:hypothetical protein
MNVITNTKRSFLHKITNKPADFLVGKGNLTFICKSETFYNTELNTNIIHTQLSLDPWPAFNSMQSKTGPEFRKL